MVQASDGVPAPTDRPLIIMVERNPWLMVVGSDSPSFALYADGLVVARNPDASGYQQWRMSEEAREGLLTRVASEEFLELDAYYEVSDVTDQPSIELHVWIGGQRKSVSVYGDLRNDSRDRAQTPDPFRRAFEALVALPAASPSPWLPGQVEVLLWPYPSSVEVPMEWPSEWPPFEETRLRGEDLRQILLPADQYPRLLELRRNLGDRQAVKLAGKKWALSYRFPFPHEEAWSQ
jgi:hypothetical protein